MIRLEWIRRCLTRGDLAEAARQIAVGRRLHSHDPRSQMLYKYHRMEKDMLTAPGDKSGLIAVKREMWLEGGSEADLSVMRSLMSEDAWAAFVDPLLEVIRRPIQKAWIYAHEKRWDDLMTLIEADTAHVDIVEVYRKTLEKKFASRMGHFYEQVAEARVAQAKTRDGYREAVAYLGRIVAMGRHEQAQKIVERLRAQYPRKTALLEELDKLA